LPPQGNLPPQGMRSSSGALPTTTLPTTTLPPGPLPQSNAQGNAAPGVYTPAAQLPQAQFPQAQFPQGNAPLSVPLGGSSIAPPGNGTSPSPTYRPGSVGRSTSYDFSGQSPSR